MFKCFIYIFGDRGLTPVTHAIEERIGRYLTERGNIDMTWTEIKSKIKDIFKSRFDYQLSENEPVFEYNAHTHFTIDSMRGDRRENDAVLVAYIEDGEDGDRYYPYDYDLDLEKMVDDMIKEIERDT